MSRFRFPTAVLLLVSGLLVLFAAPAGATPPQKGARYSGLITVQHFPEREVEFALSFTVDPTGREVEAISFPDGAPFGLKCQQGPLGEPASEGRHVAIQRGAISTSFPLEFLFPGAEKSGQPNLGTVHLEGGFRPHGLFVGTLDNRTPIKSCRGSWDFKLHVQSR